MLDFTDINNTQEDSYKVISSGNPVDLKPINVTMAELATNPQKYSSRVVRLKNVLHGDTTYEAWWTAGYPTTEYYLYQEGSSERMFYSWDYPLYEKNNIVGIFDDGCDNLSFTIEPLSGKHIKNALNDIESDTEIVTNNNITISYSNGTIFLSSYIDAIEIYNVNGALITKQDVHDNNVSANLNQGIYIVRIIQNNIPTTCKIAIK
jgi:hypothetical protein